MQIRFVSRADIDKTRWNSCIHYANNGNIFGYMWYLDNIAKEWDALVEDEYVSVMPLFGRQRRWGGQELYQPPLIRESGVYSVHALSPKRVQAFLDAIPATYKVQHLHGNTQMTLPNMTFSNGTVEQGVNYQLFLNDPYETLAQAYAPSLPPQLDKAVAARLIPTTSINPEQLIDFYRKHSPSSAQLEWRTHAYLRIMYNVLHRGWGSASAVLDAQKQLLSAHFFMYSHGKVIRLLSATSPKGKELGAEVYLYDTLIRRHAGRPGVLDFNTSESFPEQWGATPSYFPKLSADYRKWKVF